MGRIGSNSKGGLVKDNASAKKTARKSSRQTKLDRFFELEKDLKRMCAELREAAFQELQAAFQDLEFHLPIALVFVFGQPLLIAIFGLPDEDGQLPHEIGLSNSQFFLGSVLAFVLGAWLTQVRVGIKNKGAGAKLLEVIRESISFRGVMMVAGFVCFAMWYFFYITTIFDTFNIVKAQQIAARNSHNGFASSAVPNAMPHTVPVTEGVKYVTPGQRMRERREAQRKGVCLSADPSSLHANPNCRESPIPSSAPLPKKKKASPPAIGISKTNSKLWDNGIRVTEFSTKLKDEGSDHLGGEFVGGYDPTQWKAFNDDSLQDIVYEFVEESVSHDLDSAGEVLQ